MLDSKLLRESPETVKAGIAKKHLDGALFDQAHARDLAWRAAVQQVEAGRAEQKAANDEMSKLKKGSPEFVAKLGELRALSGKVKTWEESEKMAKAACDEAMLALPNIPHASVPEGRTPEENVVHATHGSIEAVSAHAMPHWEIGGFSNLIDFARGAKVTGAGFPFLIGDAAKLSRALLQFFLDEDVKAGYTEVSPPIFVNAASATATGQLPDKEGQMYETADKLYAVPTAEVPLTNFYRDEIVEQDALPICRCAYTPCFRREAGSYGKDVRGLNRVHQFDKVELLKWVHPSASYDELEKLRGDAERLLRKLELPYRVLLMCGGDLGFAQSKKYDLEVWAAGQKRWLEVSSCSNFEAFQARRAQIRFRNKDTGKPELVHTLNGSGLAVPRVLAALLENNLQADGRVKIPAALVPYFGKEYLNFK
jgi:seryl-tRNA synthetase